MAKRPNLLGNLNLGNLNEVTKSNEEFVDEKNKEMVLSHFNFSYDLEDNMVEYLKNQTLKLQGTMSKAYTEIGKILAETQERLSNNKNGVFESWFVQLGFAKRTVYNLINRGNYIVQNLHNKNFIEALPLTLSYEVTNPNCPEELREQVLNGEITTLKEFNLNKSKMLIELIEPAAEVVEVLDVNEMFKEDFKSLNQNFRNFNKMVEEKFEFISQSKKEYLTQKIESLNKEIEKLMKNI